MAATANFKWLFTGGQDGFIRKYDMISSINGDTPLTATQRHGLADSIQRAGVLTSAWENEEVAELNNTPTILAEGEIPDPPKVSPVFSIDVHSQAVWCVSGTENGTINLYTVRHQEGKIQHVLRGHKSAVSVLKILPGEQTLLSGSWDKTIKLWDLNNGAIITQYNEIGAQLVGLQLDPTKNVFSATSIAGCVFVYDIRTQKGLVKKFLPSLSNAPPFSLSSCWSPDSFKIFVGRRNSCVDEFDYRQGAFIRNIAAPNGSGIVSAVEAIDDRYLLIASHDNIRMYDLYSDLLNEKNIDVAQTFVKQEKLDPLDEFFALSAPIPEKPKKTETDLVMENDFNTASVPFVIISGHHGGHTASILRNEKYLVTASGTRGWEGTSTNLCLAYQINKLKEK